MSADFDSDALARLRALEHAFMALTLISANNYAALADTNATEAIKQFRAAIESAIFDDRSIPNDVRDRMRCHLKRLFDHVANMAKTAEDGYEASRKS